ncbi:sporulation integral membrane protein YtvI [Anoxybacillus sp. J5B_2022]|uniref:sporulation integral membrane protein YtvI n=1 Tax=Anoxybacillus sp. J5B_2022 TaxID=3003246 RepID=UPI0022868BCD|nr:sporulation integral membrane protein YtvI [Anoxybacillus sp. J5B_2022]MCZ0756624.1 sporulation integral membrane protein YtvI [Anoxybacillus sp. J5B_2022]
MKKWFVLAILASIAFFLLPYSLPLVLAFITAFLLEPFVQKLQTDRLKRIHAVTIVFSLFLLAIGGLSYFIVAILVEQTIMFSQKMPSLLSEMTAVVNHLIRKWQSYSSSIPHEIIVSLENSVETLKNMLLSFATNLTQSMIRYVAMIPEFLIHFLVYLVALFLISLDWPRLKKSLEKHLSERTKQRLTIIMTQLSRAGIGFIKAQFLLSVITFLLALGGLLMLRVDYPLLFSFLIVIVDILPILGTGSVLVPWGILNIANGHGATGIGLIVLFVVITVIRRTIEPKIFSSNLGISPLAALVSVYLGFRLLGFIGLFVGPALVIVIEAMVKAGIIKFSFKI